MSNNSPYEIIASPFEVYIAPVGTAFPAVGSTPGGSWTKLGQNGIKNQAEGGVHVVHEQTMVEFRTEGCTGPAKINRTAESLKISFNLHDLSTDLYAEALTGSEDTPNTHVALRRGLSIDEVALLIRGDSPHAANKNCQWQIPRAVQTGNSDIQLSKGTMAGVAFTYTAVEDTNATSDSARFGHFQVAS